MPVSPSAKLSVIVGVQHAQENLPDIMRALCPASHPDVELIFCHTMADPDVPTLVGNEGHVRTVCCPEGSLIPHLWRDGILIANGERIGTTTAHCIPAAGWVDALVNADLEVTAVLAGTIEADPEADAKGQAIFLQRYAAFAPPQTWHEVHEPAADNALYRRSDLLRHPDLLRRGFWEPSFHKAFRAEGSRFVLDPNLRVIHYNRYSALQYMRQRLAHGREFGFTRASGRPFHHRLLLVLLSPGILPLMLSRILRRALGKPGLRRQLATAWLWLPWFIVAWAAGEASGYFASLVPRKEGARMDRSDISQPQ
jgi:hypothetical protein